MRIPELRSRGMDAPQLLPNNLLVQLGDSLIDLATCCRSLLSQQINFRVADREKAHLERYGELTERTVSDILRQYIRSLSVSGVLNPLDRLAIPLDADPQNTARGS